MGNGIAGVTAAHTLREAGFDGELTIVGDEPHPAYSRPALSKALLLEEAGLTSHHLPAPTHGATELMGLTVSGLDLDTRCVLLDGGEGLPYDRLVVASGSRARRLSTLPGEVTLRGLDDALYLRERLASVSSVIVVGGGPLGMEIASACRAGGCEVTLVSQGMPLVQQLGVHLAGILTRAALDRGLAIVESAGAVLEASADGMVRVVVAEGGALEADLVVSAVGDVANTEWLASTGLSAPDGIHVDTRGLARPDVAAVGDVAVMPTPYGRRRIPLWTSAIEQAKTAAAALLLGEAASPLELRPYFWTEQFGLTLKAAGRLPVSGDPEYVEGGPGAGLMRWPEAAVALNYRIPIPRLRRLSVAAA
ncbi:NAD(P)/FAD-dependent oxidoreductase [Nocardioides sp. Iso805N]|uniref:NAD(P)/FAD-dependent oxidoreductase n=1 Tax=Nocardioides sp. Iso805N TaxID=1283287 RepID=UPI0018DED889|nr:FAD-dependent oxidoreductase [Nocardioides sp. Iso805N]